jgi:alkylation response protein AidB-like acyl-CoA dehydrogenase
MRHDIPEDLAAVADLARRFVDKELLPHEDAVERAGIMPPDLRHTLRKRALAAGLYGYNMPEEAGGPGLAPLGQVLIREQLGRVAMPLSDTVSRPPHALLFCDAAQRARFLVPAMNADKYWAFALTEPQAGSDVGAMTTRATPCDGGWRLNGGKHFISNADTADFLVVVARVPEPDGPGAVTAFLLEAGTPGFRIGRTHAKMGWHGYTMSELVFEDAYIPRANLLGAVGQGLQVAMSNINDARIGVAAHCVGMAQRALDLALEHARTRIAFGKPIAQFQGLQWMLADMAVAVEQARALLYAAARDMETSGDSRVSVSMAKLAATEMAGRVADQALQIFGGAGYVAESPIEMIYRDVRAFRIGEGTSEIQKNQIARGLLGKGFRA